MVQNKVIQSPSAKKLRWCFPFWKRLFADTLSVNKKIFADTLSANKKLFADTQSVNKKILNLQRKGYFQLLIQWV